jgi:hypothetical protein
VWWGACKVDILEVRGWNRPRTAWECCPAGLADAALAGEQRRRGGGWPGDEGCRGLYTDSSLFEPFSINMKPVVGHAKN